MPQRRDDIDQVIPCRVAQMWGLAAAGRCLKYDDSLVLSLRRLSKSEDKPRDELLNREIFLSLKEARYVFDRWRLVDNHYRIHSSLNYQTPATFAADCVLPAATTPQNTAELTPRFSHTLFGTKFGRLSVDLLQDECQDRDGDHGGSHERFGHGAEQPSPEGDFADLPPFVHGATFPEFAQHRPAQGS